MKKSNYILLTIILMVIGFASVATTLIINGNANIGANTSEFDVYFSNAKVDGIENKKVITSPKVIEFTKDMSLKDETYVLDYDVTNGSKNYDASVTITCTESNEYLSINNEFDTTEILGASKTRSGKLTITVTKPYVSTDENPTYDTTIECKINVSGNTRTELETEEPVDKYVKQNWTLAEDLDGSGDVSFGDAIKFGTDTFYVYDIEGDNVKLFKEKGLDVGFIEFSTTSQMGTARNSYEGSLVELEVNKYRASLEEAGAEIENARLITLDELVALGCSVEKASCKANYVKNSSNQYVEDATFTGAPAWTYSASYFTSTPKEDSTSAIYRVLQQGNLDTGIIPTRLMLAVKPVIEVSKTNIKINVE